MCKAILKKAIMESPHMKLREKIATEDPLAKALGYDGLHDPLGEAQHKLMGTEHELNKKSRRRQERLTQEFKDAERAPTGGHIQSIAAKKARLG